jgi:hypothetical protein
MGTSSNVSVHIGEGKVEIGRPVAGAPRDINAVAKFVATEGVERDGAGPFQT